MTIDFFKILAQKYPNKAYLVPNLGIFVFSQNLELRQIQGCRFQIWQYCFQIPTQGYPNQTFLVPDLSFFVFSWNFSNTKIWVCEFQTWQ